MIWVSPFILIVGAQQSNWHDFENSKISGPKAFRVVSICIATVSLCYCKALIVPSAGDSECPSRVKIGLLDDLRACRLPGEKRK